MNDKELAVWRSSPHRPVPDRDRDYCVRCGRDIRKGDRSWEHIKPEPK